MADEADDHLVFERPALGRPTLEKRFKGWRGCASGEPGRISTLRHGWMETRENGDGKTEVVDHTPPTSFVMSVEFLWDGD